MAGITFQKRQREMKRLEKQRMKAERRAQRKLEKSTGSATPPQDKTAHPETEPQGQA